MGLFNTIGQERKEPLLAATPESAADAVLQTNSDPDIVNHFPFPTIRDAQIRALAAITESAQGGKKFTLIEAPTGVGKSGIAIAAASWAKTRPASHELGSKVQAGAYILSTQKTLTKQYLGDFAKNGLLELKGRANYYCATHDTDCGAAAALQGDDPDENCSKRGVCPYAYAKQEFMSHPVGVTNFSYYLTETMYAGRLPQRSYLALDECHNIENQILGFTDTEFTPQRAAELDIELPVLMPGVATNTAAALAWFESVCYPKLSEYIRDLEALMHAADERAEKIAMAKKFAAWENFKKRVDMFVESPRHGDWICFSDINPKTGRGTKNLIIKPLTATLFADDLLFSRAANVVMMSATILDFRTFMRNLGIDPAQTNTMAVPSEFPIENRPIFYKPVANMGYRTKEQALPLVAEAILKLMKKYAGKKGIIHCQSFANLVYFRDYLAERAGAPPGHAHELARQQGRCGRPPLRISGRHRHFVAVHDRGPRPQGRLVEIPNHSEGSVSGSRCLYESPYG